MSKAGVILVFIFALLAGAVLGVIVYNKYYEISEPVMEKYDVVIMFIPAISLFTVGYVLGTRMKGATADINYRPMFQGNVQQLGREGEKIVMVALQRAGIIREK